jgi:hypothetical protein
MPVTLTRRMCDRCKTKPGAGCGHRLCWPCRAILNRQRETPSRLRGHAGAPSRGPRPCRNEGCPGITTHGHRFCHSCIVHGPGHARPPKVAAQSILELANGICADLPEPVGPAPGPLPEDRDAAYCEMQRRARAGLALFPEPDGNPLADFRLPRVG